MAFAAMLPMLAGMASQGQGQQTSALDQVDPQKNGQDAQQAQQQNQGFQMATPPPDQTQGSGGGAQVLSMLSKLGQTQSAATQPSNLTAPPPAGNYQNPGQAPGSANVPGQQVQTSGQQPLSTLATNANGQPAAGTDFGAFLMQLFGGQ